MSVGVLWGGLFVCVVYDGAYLPILICGMSYDPGSCILQSISYCLPFIQCVAMNAVPLRPLTFRDSPHSCAASQLASYAIWSMF